jgi:transposase-like protein
MTDIFPRTCTVCGKTSDDHFTYKSKAGIRAFPKCKKCHNAGNYTKRPTGFAKLDKETQQELMKAIGDKNQKLTHIARRFEITYSTLKKWILAFPAEQASLTN